MKKKIKVLGLLFTSFLLAGCNLTKTDRHVHTYSEEWSYNVDGHFHKCTYENCSNTSIVEKHTLENGVCSVCGYTATSSDMQHCEHNFTDWVTIQEATATAAGSKQRTCKKCGLVVDELIPVIEDEDEIWVANSETHYKVDSNGKRLSAAEPHTLVDYNGDDTHVNTPPTCSVPGIVYKKCSVCGKIVAESIAALSHDFETVTSDSTVTCTQNGILAEVCKRCGERRDRNSDALGHNLVSHGTGKAGVTKNVCDRTGCNYVEYILDISQASGWNQPTVKMNAKSGADSMSTWDVTNAIESGIYNIEIEALMSYESHGSRYWNNMSATDNDPDPANNDTADQDPYRYYFRVNGETVINPNVLNTTWSDLGYEGVDKNGSPKYGSICTNVVISNANSFSLVHGNIGYTLIISKIRLIRVGEYTPVDCSTSGHNLVTSQTGKAGVTKTYCDRVGCDYAEYVLDISQATGWNKPTTKMNGKESTNNKSTWDVAGVIADGTYDIFLEAKLTDGSHKNRCWHNMSDNDPTPNNNPDKSTEDPFRYFFKINDETVINPNVTDSWESIGYTNNSVKYGAIVNRASISGASSFSLMHGSIGYSLIISNVKLVKTSNVVQHVHSFGDWKVEIPATATTDGLKYRECSCGERETAVIPATGSSSSTSGVFTITTDLTTTKTIHTQAQKEYLEYSGDYATMNPSLYPDGSKHLSDSLPVNLAWNFTPATGKTVSKYYVMYGQKSDLSDGIVVTGTSNTNINLYNTYLGRNYFMITAEYSDGVKVNSDIKSFVVDETGPRNLAIDGLTNCRDMGGRSTSAGAKIKQGLIYRTSGYKYDYSTQITDAGKDVMKNTLRVKTEINVADGTSYNLGSYVNATTYNAFMDYAKQNGVSKHHFSRNAESVKNVFKILADENNYPVFYHCRIGTDRTGLVGNLVYGLLGVPLNMIYQDYLFSNFGKIGEKRYIGSQAGQDDISIYMQEILAMPGSTFQEKTYNTLLSIGVPAETLNKVINILTDGTKPNNAQGQVVANANQLALSGTTATYTARSSIVDRNEPEYYAKMSNNATATLSFTTTSAGTAKIYGYLGHNSYSSSLNINSSISVTVDGNVVTVPSKTFAEAGMGNISNRTNYYFVSLGEVSNLSAGEHTIVIKGLANDMKLGTLSVFGVSGTANQNQGSGNENQGGQTSHTHNIVAGQQVGSSNLKVLECECGELGDYGYELSCASASDMVSGQVPTSDKNTRLGKGSAKANVWNISGIKAGTYAVYLKAKTQSGNENAYWNAGDQMSHGGKANENGGASAGADAYRYKIAVGDGNAVNVGIADGTYSGAGLGSTSAAWTSVSVAEITVGANASTITLSNMENGFAIWVYGVRLVKLS